MSEVIRSVVRYVPWVGKYGPPTSYRAEVCLVRWNTDLITVNTPWACLTGFDENTSEGRLEGVLHGSFATDAEAVAEAKRRYPHWDRDENQAVCGRLVESIRWRGELVGPSMLADVLCVDIRTVYDMARGKVKVSRKQAQSAQEWKGGPV